ncbi:importin subunit alpha-7-like [Zophobas morio]|uniref:importin subunit alpha-7-like n=1 Tax=Zophobas morio TaxID=2755281 RepID=UPI0030833532
MAVKNKAFERISKFASRHEISFSGIKKRRSLYNVELRKFKRSEHIWKKRNVKSFGEEQLLIPSDTLLSSFCEEFHKLSQDLKDSDLSTRKIALEKFRLLFSSPFIEEVKKEKGLQLVPTLLLLLADDAYQDLQYEAACLLTTFSCFSGDILRKFATKDVVKHLVGLVNMSNELICEQAVWTLGNLAGNCLELAQRVLSLGAVPAINSLIRRASRLCTVKLAVWTLSNLCQRDTSFEGESEKHCWSALSWLINSSDDIEILTDTCWSLQNLCFVSGGSCSDSLSQSGILGRLVDLVSSEEMSIKMPALRTLGIFICHNPWHIQIVLNCGILSAIRDLLKHNNESLVMDTCWVVSLLSEGSCYQIQFVIKTNIPQQLTCLMKSESRGIREEAAWAVCNLLTCGTQEQTVAVLNLNCTSDLCAVLVSELDIDFLRVALSALERALRVSINFCSDCEFCQGCSSCERLKNLRIDIEESAMTTLTELSVHHNAQLSKFSLRVLHLLSADDAAETSSSPFSPRLTSKPDRDRRRGSESPEVSLYYF